jgi:hypothetical protein
MVSDAAPARWMLVPPFDKRIIYRTCMIAAPAKGAIGGSLSRILLPLNPA